MMPRFRLKFLIILVLFKLCCALLPNLGDRCYIGNRIRGTCQLFDNCPKVKNAYNTHGIMPQMCTPHSSKLVVCCGDETMVFKSKSLAKCREYSRSVNCSRSRFNSRQLSGNHLMSSEDFPHMAKILYEKIPHDGRIYVRNDQGVLVSSRYVLSTASSLKIPRRKPVKVRLGTLELFRFIENEIPIDYNIEKTIVYPNYQSPSIHNDIGLIKLSDQVEFSDYIRPICLPDTDIHSNVVYRINYEYDSSRLSRPLVKYQRRYVPNTYCNDEYRRIFNSLNDNFVCTASMEAMDHNYGYLFEGAPIMMDHPSVGCSHVLLGVSVKNFESRTADAAIKVYNYRKWIETIIWEDDQDP